MSKRQVRMYLHDIDDAITAIFFYTKKMSYHTFENDRKTREAVILNFIIIGEAIKKIPQDTLLEFPDVPWKEFAGMRDKLVHDYFQMSAMIIWETIQQDLPVLLHAVNELHKRDSRPDR